MLGQYRRGPCSPLPTPTAATLGGVGHNCSRKTCPLSEIGTSVEGHWKDKCHRQGKRRRQRKAAVTYIPEKRLDILDGKAGCNSDGGPQAKREAQRGEPCHGTLCKGGGDGGRMTERQEQCVLWLSIKASG